jgi:hypothetical protein
MMEEKSEGFHIDKEGVRILHETPDKVYLERWYDWNSGCHSKDCIAIPTHLVEQSIGLLQDFLGRHRGEVMNQETYAGIQAELLILGHVIKNMDLEGFLEAVSKAETMGPVLDPTLYIQGNEKLEQVKLLAQSAKIFQNEVLRQLEEAEQYTEFHGDKHD